MKLKKGKNFSVKSLGVQEMDVYDIEVDDNHNFFANDILIHNSCMFNFSCIVDKYMKELPREKQIDKIIKFSDDVIGGKVIPEVIQEISKNLNAFDMNALQMEREKVCDAAIFCKKKKNVMSIVDTEGTRHKSPKISITGLESKKSSLPKPIRDKLENAYKIILYENQDSLDNFVENFYDEYMNIFSIDDMITIKGVSDYNKYVDDKTQDGFLENNEFVKGTPSHIKAAITHNKYIKKNGIDEWIAPIEGGEKLKIVNMVYPNPTGNKEFAWVGEYNDDVYKLKGYMDFEKQFQKSFIEPLKNVTDVIGWEADINRQESIF